MPKKKRESEERTSKVGSFEANDALSQLDAVSYDTDSARDSGVESSAPSTSSERSSSRKAEAKSSALRARSGAKDLVGGVGGIMKAAGSALYDTLRESKRKAKLKRANMRAKKQLSRDSKLLQAHEKKINQLGQMSDTIKTKIAHHADKVEELKRRSSLSSLSGTAETASLRDSSLRSDSSRSSSVSSTASASKKPSKMAQFKKALTLKKKHKAVQDKTASLSSDSSPSSVSSTASTSKKTSTMERLKKALTLKRALKHKAVKGSDSAYETASLRSDSSPESNNSRSSSVSSTASASKKPSAIERFRSALTPRSNNEKQKMLGLLQEVHSQISTMSKRQTEKEALRRSASATEMIAKDKNGPNISI